MHMSLRELISAIIAIIVIVAFLAIILIDVLANRPVMLPDALLVLVSLVSGVYLGQHAATNGAYAAGASAATAAVTAAKIDKAGPGV